MKTKDFEFFQAEMPMPKFKERLALLAKAMPAGTTKRELKEAANIAHKEDLETTCWVSPMFQVMRRVLFDEEHGFGETAPTYLSIRRQDREPIGDWRTKHLIKNALLGEEWEAVEIYPRESRLVDSSNQYHLFGWQNTFPIYVFNSRYVLSVEEAEELNRRTGLIAKQS